MDMDRLATPLLASLVGVLLILSLCAVVIERSVSTGMVLPMPRVGALPFSECDYVSDRDIVVLIKRDGSTQINETPVPMGELKARLTQIYENRLERIIYINSDPEVPYGAFANAYDLVASSTENLHIGLLTPQLMDAPAQCLPAPVCGLFWPGKPSFHTCIWAPIPPISIPLHSPLKVRSR
jgi:biopolymer transport protein ExbD